MAEKTYYTSLRLFNGRITIDFHCYGNKWNILIAAWVGFCIGAAIAATDLVIAALFVLVAGAVWLQIQKTEWDDRINGVRR